ncbi:MAG: hypothetical protein FJ109_04300 [Deltaproteobacteria bacterium]|nr:hypothetical protein [Deltaproteobacteria bacterium]
MLQTLFSAERKVRRWRAVFLAAVVATGVLWMLCAVVTVVDLALLAAWLLPDPRNVLPLSQAFLSSIVVLISIYGIALPLRRNMPLHKFASRLEVGLKREGYILTACEVLDQVRASARLAEGAGRGSPGRTSDLRAWSEKLVQGRSPVLLEQVGDLALRDLAGASLALAVPYRRLFHGLVLLLLLLSGSLATLIWEPGLAREALTRLLGRPRTPVAAVVADVGPQASAAAGGAQLPPCRAVSVVVTPPAYVGRPAFAAQWGSALRVLPGTVLAVACEAGGPKAPVLEHALPDSLERIDFEGGEERGGFRFSVDVSIPARTRLRIFSGDEGPPQSGWLWVDLVADQAPSCTLVQPVSDLSVGPGGTISFLVEAVDDLGLSSVTAAYMVEGLDAVPSHVELARSPGQRRLVVQRELPVTAFGADYDDRISFWVEVADANEYPGPSVCTSARRTATISSPYGAQKEVISQLAELRNGAVDLAGEGIAGLASDPPEPAFVERFRLAAVKHAQAAAKASAHMAEVGLFKQEDIRRVASLSATLDELCSAAGDLSGQPARAAALARPLLADLEQQALVLDGVVEKLLGEHLFHLSGRLQTELARLLTLAREGALDAAAERSVRRGLRKLQRMSSRAAQFRDATRPQLPRLFTPTLQGETADGGFEEIALLTGQLAESLARPDEAEWKEGLEKLSLAVEQAARSMEGSYARSMNRLSSTFRQAQGDLAQRLKRAKASNLAIRKELELLVAEVEKETSDYIRRARTIEALRDVADLGRSLSKRSRKFRASTYLPVDRKTVVEFAERQKRLSDLVGSFRIDDAAIVAAELVSLTQSMEFSLKLAIQYSSDDALVKRSRQELGKVHEARRIAEHVASRLAAIRAQRQKLYSLRSERLEGLALGLDEVHQLVAQAAQRAGGLRRMFPMFFGRFTPALERLAEAIGQSREKLGAFLLQDALKTCVYADETLERLLEELDSAARNARSASALGAGGIQPALDIEGKEKVTSRDRVQRLLSLGTGFGGREEWRRVFESYCGQLAP